MTFPQLKLADGSKVEFIGHADFTTTSSDTGTSVNVKPLIQEKLDPAQVASWRAISANLSCSVWRQPYTGKTQ